MQDFTNNAVDLDSLPKYEEVSFLPIHGKYWNIMVINLLILTIVIFIATAVFFVSIYRDERFGSMFYIGVLFLVFGFIGLLFWINRIAFRKKGYALRERDVLYRSGVWSTTTTIIPFNRIQHIAVTEGMFSRMYGLASLEIYTAGGNSSDLNIAGIEKEKAYAMKELLMKNLNNENFKQDSSVHPSDIAE